MKSQASVGGHPIHPMLVTIPIGLWVTSLVCDVIYASTRTVFWYDMAWWAMAFGVIGAIAAAVPGLIDYNTTIRRSERAYKTARLHMILNFTAVALFALNLYLRADYNAATGSMLWMTIGLSVLTMVGVGVSGWLGGELVYRDGIGMEKDNLRISMLEAEREEAELPRR